MSDKQKQATLPWIPFGFCALFSLITVLGNLWLSIANAADAGGWAIAFLGFFPTAFFFVGAATSQLQGEIMELRKQIAELQVQKMRQIPSARTNRCRIAGG